MHMKFQTEIPKQSKKIQYGHQAAIFKVRSLKINRLLPIYKSILPLKYRVDIKSQTKVKKSGKQSNMGVCQPFLN